jgi:hypothetical protein
MVSLPRVAAAQHPRQRGRAGYLDDFTPFGGIVKDTQLDGDSGQVDRVRVHDGPLGAFKGVRRLRCTIVPKADGGIEGVLGLLVLQP